MPGFSSSVSARDSLKVSITGARLLKQGFSSSVSARDHLKAMVPGFSSSVSARDGLKASITDARPLQKCFNFVFGADRRILVGYNFIGSQYFSYVEKVYLSLRAAPKGVLLVMYYCPNIEDAGSCVA